MVFALTSNDIDSKHLFPYRPAIEMVENVGVFGDSKIKIDPNNKLTKRIGIRHVIERQLGVNKQLRLFAIRTRIGRVTDFSKIITIIINRND